VRTIDIQKFKLARKSVLASNNNCVNRAEQFRQRWISLQVDQINAGAASLRVRDELKFLAARRPGI